MARAWDGQGVGATSPPVSPARDDVYADGFVEEPLPGGGRRGLVVHPADLDRRPRADAERAPLRLLLDGWIFPADASRSTWAVAQRGDSRWTATPPRGRDRLTAGRCSCRRVDRLSGRQDEDHGRSILPPLPTDDLPAGCVSLPRAVAASWDRDRLSGSSPRTTAPGSCAHVSTRRRAELRQRGFSAPAPASGAERAARLRLPGECTKRPSPATTSGCPFPVATPASGMSGTAARRDRRPVLSVILAAGDGAGTADFDASERFPRSPTRGLAAERLPRESRLGQGRRPQHRRGPAPRTAALPRHEPISVRPGRDLPGHARSSPLRRHLVDPRDRARTAPMSRSLVVVALALWVAGCATQPLDEDVLTILYDRAASFQYPDRNPVIVIPGFTGSRLVDTTNGDRVVRTARAPSASAATTRCGASPCRCVPGIPARRCAPTACSTAWS